MKIGIKNNKRERKDIKKWKLIIYKIYKRRVMLVMLLLPYAGNQVVK